MNDQKLLTLYLEILFMLIFTYVLLSLAINFMLISTTQVVQALISFVLNYIWLIKKIEVSI